MNALHIMARVFDAVRKSKFARAVASLQARRNRVKRRRLRSPKTHRFSPSFTKKGPGRSVALGKPREPYFGGGLSEALRFHGGYMNRGEREGYILRLVMAGEPAPAMSSKSGAPTKHRNVVKLVSKARHPNSYRGARRNVFFGRKPVGNTKAAARQAYRQRA